MTRYTVGFDYPAHISFEKQRYGSGTQTHFERRLILQKWYSNLRGYLPEVYKDTDGTDKKKKEYDVEIRPLMYEAAELRDKARLLYDSSFEGLATCNPAEKDFGVVMDLWNECLDEITARSGILEKAKMPSEYVTV